MKALKEKQQSFEAFKKPGNAKNAIHEFAWILHQIVLEDSVQNAEVLKTDSRSNLLETGLLYAQRFIEIAYVFTEVFIRDEYKLWKPESNNPRIIDLGGDPGAITAMYWKYRAPNAKVTVIEANPATAKVMQKNLLRRGLVDVEIINAAVAKSDKGNATLHLHRPGMGWHTQDSIDNAAANTDNTYVVIVPKIKLSSIIKKNETVDLLKIDIEGMEGKVVKELAESGKMNLIKQIIMEFHNGSYDFPKNSLVDMIDLLQQHNFKITESHLTSGRGLRFKKDVNSNELKNIANRPGKTFITLSAIRNS